MIQLNLFLEKYVSNSHSLHLNWNFSDTFVHIRVKIRYKICELTSWASLGQSLATKATDWRRFVSMHKQSDVITRGSWGNIANRESSKQAEALALYSGSRVMFTSGSVTLTMFNIQHQDFSKKQKKH